jgi:serine/threonine-protein kinase
MPDLFLSYARDDQTIAQRFAEGFKREGFDVWWDQALNPGEAFDQVTEEALAGAGAVVVLWSRTSVSSRWVRAEATQANASKRLLPVMIEPCTRPIMFELTHTAELSQWKGNRDDPAWQAFVAGVRRFLQRRAQGDSADLPALLTEPVPRPRPSLRERAAAIGAALRLAVARVGLLLRRFGAQLAFVLAGAVIASLIAWQLRPQAEREVTRFSIPATLDQSGLALSPDGRRIVYVTRGQLYSRRLDQDEATPIPGAEAPTLPFFSPDSRSIAFFSADRSGSKLKAFDFAGEATRVLADVAGAPGVVGNWDSNGRIFFGQVDSSGLSQVAAVGGVPEAFAALKDYTDLDYPDVLPGGRWVLFTGHIGPLGQTPWSGSDIVAQNVATGERKVVLKGGYFARYLPTGHLVFVRSGTLFAVAFDAQRLETRGREVPVLQGIATDEGNGFAAYAVSTNGTLIYVPGAVTGQGGLVKSVVRISSNGDITGLSANDRNYSTPRAAPDGSRIAVEVTGEDKRAHIWVMDVKTGAATQLTFEGEDRFPVWTADGREVLYTSKRGGEFAIWRKAADGTGEERRVQGGTEALVATDVHGRTLVYQDRGAGVERDLFTLDLDAAGSPQTLLSTPDDEAGGRVSPDGNWIAYVSTPTGGSTPDRRVYVRPFPNTAAGGQRAISEGLGSGPAWSPGGDAIYHMVTRPPIPLVAVPVAVTSTTLTPNGRHEVFNMAGRFDMTRAGSVLAYGAVYDVLPNSGEFLAVAPAVPRSSASTEGNASQARINVVLNWFEELKKLVPTQ